MSRLVVLSEGYTGRSYELKVEKTTIGRLEDNAFPIPEASVSSHHCEVILKGNDVIVHDLNSTNGTFINGDKITEAVLKPGQILRLGNLEIRLESGAAAPSGKKALDHTMVIPQGVKVDQLESSGTKVVQLDKNSAFGKKENKANKVFLIVGLLIGALIVGLIILAFIQLKGGGG